MVRPRNIKINKIVYMYVYAYLKEYYDQDGDSKIFDNACLQSLINLKYNSYGGMDKYITS